MTFCSRIWREAGTRPAMSGCSSKARTGTGTGDAQAGRTDQGGTDRRQHANPPRYADGVRGPVSSPARLQLAG